MSTGYLWKNTKPVEFLDLPIGAEFVYASSGPFLKRNIFTKTADEYSDTGNIKDAKPNAASALSSKLKLWFLPNAQVRILIKPQAG